MVDIDTQPHKIAFVLASFLSVFLLYSELLLFFFLLFLTHQHPMRQPRIYSTHSRFRNASSDPHLSCSFSSSSSVCVCKRRATTPTTKESYYPLLRAIGGHESIDKKRNTKKIFRYTFILFPSAKKTSRHPFLSIYSLLFF